MRKKRIIKSSIFHLNELVQDEPIYICEKQFFPMNILQIIILLAILVDFLVGLVTNILNIKSLSQHLPNEFEGLYDAQTYAKSQKYTKLDHSLD